MSVGKGSLVRASKIKETNEKKQLTKADEEEREKKKTSPIKEEQGMEASGITCDIPTYLL